MLKETRRPPARKLSARNTASKHKELHMLHWQLTSCTPKLTIAALATLLRNRCTSEAHGRTDSMHLYFQMPTTSTPWMHTGMRELHRHELHMRQQTHPQTAGLSRLLKCSLAACQLALQCRMPSKLCMTPSKQHVPANSISRWP
jgi:hypothetical protein